MIDASVEGRLITEVRRSARIDGLTAPVLIISHTRTEHLKLLIASLLKCGEVSSTPLIVSFDGPRNEEDLVCISKSINFISHLEHFDSITILSWPNNVGVDKNSISAREFVMSKFETLISLDDDLYVYPYFLKFMNDALVQYSNIPEVVRVSGYLTKYLRSHDHETCFFTQNNVPYAFGVWTKKERDFHSDWYHDKVGINLVFSDIRRFIYWARRSYGARFFPQVHSGMLRAGDVEGTCTMLFTERFCVRPPISLVEISEVGGEGKFDLLKVELESSLLEVICWMTS